jgi:hypothetical protein
MLLFEQHGKPTHIPAFPHRRRKKRAMSSYYTLIGILLMVIFPVLLPLLAGGVRVLARLSP